MHDYPRASDDEVACQLPIETYRFNDARDLAHYASADPCIGWRSWPEIWHLDDSGRFRCYFKGSSHDSIQRWADDPQRLHRSRAEGLRSGGCADRWVVVDSRTTWMRPSAIVDESDVEAFTRLRSCLASIDVALLDVVVFDRQHWWSLHELTAGTTRWPTARIS